jgi:DNA-binding beta-propeller fold protein YncE
MRRRRISSLLFAAAILFSLAPIFAQEQQTPAQTAHSKGTAPLKLVGKYEFPSDVKGSLDLLLPEPHVHRLFTTPQARKAVMVFDLQTHKLLHTIEGIERPHSLLYREDLKRLYVTDGGPGALPGALKIFDGTTYDLIKSVELLADADAIAYDSKTKYVYVVNGGAHIKMTYSMISIIDTTSGEKLDDIKVEGDTLDGMAIETPSSRLYVTNVAKNQVEVIDTNKRAILASWPIDPRQSRCVAIALDQAHHRLFVGCRSGQIVVFDTGTGKQLQALPINQGVDDMDFDSASKRLYAACPAGNGSVDVYKETDPDHYESLGQIPTGPGEARNGRLAPEIKRYFAAVPQHDSTNAQILEFVVQ